MQFLRMKNPMLLVKVLKAVNNPKPVQTTNSDNTCEELIRRIQERYPNAA